MPNGFHGTESRWERLESPLRTLDESLKDYANRFGMTLSRNNHNWPERSLTWTEGVERKIHIYLETEGAAAFSVGVVAWRLDKDGHFVRQAKIASGRSIENLKLELVALLDQGRSLVVSWSEADLPRVGDGR